MGFPSGFCSWICFPPGPTSISFRNCSPAALHGASDVGDLVPNAVNADDETALFPMVADRVRHDESRSAECTTRISEAKVHGNRVEYGTADGPTLARGVATALDRMNGVKRSHGEP